MLRFIVIAVVVGMFLFDVVVSLLNYRQRELPVPGIVADVYDPERYQKWLNYSMETLRFGLITTAVSTLVMVGLLLVGAFGWLERLTNAWFAHPIPRTLAFLGLFFAVDLLISLPFGYYATFVIEEKYGFNRSTRRTFWVDQLKNLLLAAVLGGGLLAGLQALYLRLADRLWLFILMAWAVAALVMVLMFGLNKVFVKIFNKLTPLEDGELKTRIEALAERVGYRVSAVSVMDASRRSTKLNAFFSGLGKTRAVVLYDTLVEKMSTDEIVSVLAHELGHAVHKDIPKALLRQVLLIGAYLGLFGLIAGSGALPEAFGLSGAHFGFSMVLFSILISPLDLLLDIPLNALSRQAEYAADAFAAQQTEKAFIRSALVRLAQENLSNLNPHPLFVRLHYSHPPLAQRLEALAEG